MLHTVFGLDQSFDIKKLGDAAAMTDLVQKSQIDRLDVLVAPLAKSAGSNNGADLNLLAEGIIRQARESYDVTLIDTSPLYPVNRRTGEWWTPSYFQKQPTDWCWWSWPMRDPSETGKAHPDDP